MFFDSIFDFVYDMYDLIIATSQLLFEWFNSTVSPEISTIFEIPSTATNLDLILGTLIPAILIITFVGFIMKAIKPI